MGAALEFSTATARRRVASFRSRLYSRLPLVGLRTRDAPYFNGLDVAANKRRPVVFACPHPSAIPRHEANIAVQRACAGVSRG